MRTPALVMLFFLLVSNLSAQPAYDDTARTSIDLTGFKLSNKVVRAEYGKVIMYFNQADYMRQLVNEDTVVTTPKYFIHEDIAGLLRAGRVKIIRRSDNTVETTIFHSPKANNRMWLYELHDGVVFFINPGEIRSVGPIRLSPPDKSHSHKKDIVIQKNDFAYDEVFPDTNDKASVKIKDYFPLKPLFHYVYDNNNEYGELDTNICKSTILDGVRVFYFAACYNQYGIVSIGATMFGRGVYLYKNDSLFTIEADNEKEVQEKQRGNPTLLFAADASLLMPAYMKPGDSTVSRKRWAGEKEVITYLKKEDIQIGKVTHKDCIKFKIRTYWPNTVYLEYIWLKKNFGLVKWMRTTGRVDELVNSF